VVPYSNVQVTVNSRKTWGVFRGPCACPFVSEKLMKIEKSITTERR